MMVHEGLVDGQVHGISRSYPDSIRPVLQVIPRRPGVNKVSGVYLMIFRDRILMFADATVNISPSSDSQVQEFERKQQMKPSVFDHVSPA
jgi:malate dehydrogenase (oxaloacetate-decarboxylating)(NADP+)